MTVKRLVALGMALALCACAAPSHEPWYAGSFESPVIANGTSSMRVGLNCAPEGSCRVVGDRVRNGKPEQSVLDFQASLVRHDLRIPNNILASTRERSAALETALSDNESAPFRDAIAPLLNSTIEFDRCVDIFSRKDDRSHTFTLCATPRTAPPQVEAYLIWPILTDQCDGRLFCPHFIYPMRRR